MGIILLLRGAAFCLGYMAIGALLLSPLLVAMWKRGVTSRFAVLVAHDDRQFGNGATQE